MNDIIDLPKGAGQKRALKRKEYFGPYPHLTKLASDLSRRRPKLPLEARPHASNIIEQIAQIETAEDLERIRPFMARSAKLLEALS